MKNLVKISALALAALTTINIAAGTISITSTMPNSADIVMEIEKTGAEAVNPQVKFTVPAKGADGYVYIIQDDKKFDIVNHEAVNKRPNGPTQLTLSGRRIKLWDTTYQGKTHRVYNQEDNDHTNMSESLIETINPGDNFNLDIAARSSSANNPAVGIRQELIGKSHHWRKADSYRDTFWYH